MKGPAEKNFEGIYANPRLMHAVGLVVGCVCHVQVKSGSVYEGVLKTISNKADFVLEMARKIEVGEPGSNSIASSSPIAPISSTDQVFDKLIFKFDDIVVITACNVDPDFATRENFTDTGISKFNGQVQEKELEPWDEGAMSNDSLSDLTVGEGEANGWNPDDMFRLNEEKYGVKSSFDSTLRGYTIPLNKQNTPEYKQNEARADKIAQEIESGLHHRNRAALENGDEEDKYSAVVRPTNNYPDNANFRPVFRNRKPPNSRGISRNPPSQHMTRGTQPFHRVPSPASGPLTTNYKMMSPPTPSSTPPMTRPPSMGVPIAFQQGPPAIPPPVSVAPPPPRATPPTTPTSVPQEDNHKINGEVEKSEVKFAPKPPRSLNLQAAANKDIREAVTHQQVTNKSIDRRKDPEKKTPMQKSRDDKTDELKKFHHAFKLEDKTIHEKDSASKSEAQSFGNVATPLPPKHQNKEKPKEDERKPESTPENRTSPDTPKGSTLNPNAKEFVLNPHAKSFTPRGIPPMQNVVSAPVQAPPRLQSQSPIMAMPQPHLMPTGMPQTVFNMPHYVVSATPVSMPVAPSFTPNASVTQPQRFRRAMPRHDLSQPVHVQAATGQPILAQPTLSAPQFTIQYAPSPGMIHHPPGPPQQLAYAQMYSLMPRVIAPQPVSMVPTSAAYDSQQIPTHVYMHPGAQGLQHAMASAGNQGQHSAPSTPQSGTPSLHPAPSPVHQPPPQSGPPSAGHPSNAPTPQPQQVMYSHMAGSQHPALHTHVSTAPAGHHFAAASYGGAPQPIVLLPQQPHGPHPASFGPAAGLQNHLHGGQNPAGSHAVLPGHHAPLAMIPTSAGMVHTPTAISSGHYVPHSTVTQHQQFIPSYLISDAKKGVMPS